ncbi:hypothetical protein ACPB9J_05960 [Streptomyces lavendulocolor]|uniref:hypothetical protein n=1 Tax=Streptomyces lavendulocolor TaxID=67316 RepID=UPI003C2FB3A3
MTSSRRREPASWSPEPLDASREGPKPGGNGNELEIMHTSGRYACGVCGALPTAADDPDAAVQDQPRGQG